MLPSLMKYKTQILLIIGYLQPACAFDLSFCMYFTHYIYFSQEHQTENPILKKRRDTLMLMLTNLRRRRDRWHPQEELITNVSLRELTLQLKRSFSMLFQYVFCNDNVLNKKWIINSLNNNKMNVIIGFHY